MFAAFILVVFHRFSPAGLLSVFTSELNMSTAQFALLSSSYFYLYSLLQIPVGFLLDYYGPRRVGIFSLSVMTLGSFIFALGSELPWLMLGRIILSVGAACVWGTLMKIQHLQFPGKIFGVLTGVGAMAGSWGIILAGPPFTRLISTLGWRQSLLGITLLSLGLLVCSLFFIREVPLQEDMDGERISLKEALGKTKKVLLHKGNWYCFMAHFGIYGTYAALVGIWIVPYLVGLGSTGSQGAYAMISLSGLGFMVGGPALGAVSDGVFRGQPRPVLLMSTLSLAALYLLVLNPAAYIYREVTFKILFFFIGFFSSTAVMTMVLGRSINPSDSSGSAIGFANSGGFMGAAFFQMAVGTILAKGWEGGYVAGIMVYRDTIYKPVVLLMVLFTLISFFAVYGVKNRA